jgi:DNA (cytosine-5)-methyltransferase 1
MRVVDLFAGLGGMSCGAIEAGADVVLAVDSDPAPLKVLGANAPQTTIIVATLGEGRDEVSLPPAAPDLHVHLSTPCTELSVARRGPNPGTTGGLQMIRWAVSLALGRNDRSWSIENVSTKATRTLMTELVAAHPKRVAFGVFDSADFGAPQSRRRLVAGPPKLIRMLHSIPCARHVSVRDAFESAGKELPAAYCKNQTRSQNGGPTMRRVETQSFTVCAGHALTWCDADGKTVSVMTARDSAILMGFPLTWTLPKGSRAAQRAVGNAMCVALSKAIVLAAIAVRKGDAAVSAATIAVPEAPAPPPPPTKKRPAFELSHRQYRRLRRRVEALEGGMSISRSGTQHGDALLD